MTRRVDFALFMVAAIENTELIRMAPAIVGCQRRPRRLSTALSAKAWLRRPNSQLHGVTLLTVSMFRATLGTWT